MLLDFHSQRCAENWIAGLQVGIREMHLFAANNIHSVLVEATQELFGSRRRITILLLIALLTGLVGPFGTRPDFLVVERYLYWMLVVFGTVLPAQIIFLAFDRLAQHSGWRERFWVPAASIIAACPVTAVVMTIAIGFGARPDIADVTRLFSQSALVILAIATLLRLAQTPPDTKTHPNIQRRLPGAKRGRLIRLTAQDHYVEIVTDRGATLVQMRLRDAINETSPTAGAQVHRSHWVASDAVTTMCRKDGALQLQLSDGSAVPVGRTFRKHAKEAGVLY